MQDREISPSGLEFQPGTRQALSLVEIPTPRVRFPYPTWTLMMDCYIPSTVRLWNDLRLHAKIILVDFKLLTLLGADRDCNQHAFS